MDEILKKKVLLLGGSYFQIPAIKYAKEAGYYVITCDYLPNNPGHKFADEYYNISTTDKEVILKLAKKLKIDGIVAYGSEPAVPAAAYVAENLNLPGNSYDVVVKLIQKDLFRNFLKKNDFNVPKAKGYSSYREAIKDITRFKFPIMVKPVDSSASRGVRKIENKKDLKKAIEYALKYSNVKRIILEEFIVKKGPQLHGDAFVVGKKLVFCYLGDHHFDTNINTFVPCATTLPSLHAKKVIEKVENEVQKVIENIGFKQGAINIEARINKNDEVFIMEIGPRNGGHIVPQLARYAGGLDMIKNTVEIALGNPVDLSTIAKKGFFAVYALPSEKTGKLAGIKISDYLNPLIIEKHIIKNSGEKIKPFTGINNTIGFFIFNFKNENQMHRLFSNINKYISVDLFTNLP